MEVTQLLIITLEVALLFVGLRDVACAVTGYESSSNKVVRRTSAQLDEIATEGKDAMRDLSEQYINEVRSLIRIEQGGRRNGHLR